MCEKEVGLKRCLCYQIERQRMSAKACSVMNTEQSKNGDFAEKMNIKEGHEVDEIDLLGHGLLMFEVGQGKCSYKARIFMLSRLFSFCGLTHKCSIGTEYLLKISLIKRLKDLS